MNKIVEDLEENFRNKRGCQEHDPGLIISYKIKIDTEYFEVDKPEITGEELLKLAGKTTAAYRIFALKESEDPEVKPHEIVDLRDFGIEKFKTIKRGTTEGGGVASSTSLMTDEDLANLDNKFQWKELPDNNGSSWLIIESFSVPEGYNHSSVTVALQITSSYPQSQIDMAYFYPALARNDGKAIGQLSSQTIDGKTYQRWSRHRDLNVNPWRLGVDDVLTHLKFVETWLQDELLK